MKTVLIGFTKNSEAIMQKLRKRFGEQGIRCEAWLKRKGVSREEAEAEGICLLDDSLASWTRRQFQDKDALIFVGAAGICVRSIAPYVRSKKTDPAVIVIDEQGRHAISLLSGHIGGANALTLLAAKILGAEPVITTATDLHGKFAVDAFAARREMHLDSMSLAKEIAAALVEDRRIGMYSAFPVLGEIPEELDLNGKEDLGFAVDVRRSHPFERTLHLVPRAVALGIGCRKGTDGQALKEFVREELDRQGIFLESVCAVASIELKKDEAGLRTLAEDMGVPFQVYTAEELEQAESEDGFTESGFVKQVTGIGNVCERSALCMAGTRRLLIRKTARNGMTLAAALTDYTLCMEE